MKLKKVMSIMLAMALMLCTFSVCGFNADAEEGVVKYTLYTEDIGTEQLGYTFIYVIKYGEKYYALGDESALRETKPAIDVTAYYKNGAFENIPNNIGVAFLNCRIEDEYATEPNFYVDDKRFLSAYIPQGDLTAEEYIGKIAFEEMASQSVYYSYDEETKRGVLLAITSYYDSDNGYNFVVNEGTLALKEDGDKVCFAMKNTSDIEELGVDAEMYAIPCQHSKVVHSPLSKATCMEKGCGEYWYCQICRKYFTCADFSEYSYFLPILPATGHKYVGDKCESCDKATPVYTKVTSLESMALHPENTSYIIVAQLNGKNYVLGMPDTTYILDGNEDERLDILDVDENENGIPDLAERDDDEDGKYDYLNYDYDEDGEISDDEMSYYVDELVWSMGNSNDMWARFRELAPIEVEKNADGSISVLDKGALEFYAQRHYTDEEAEDQYGYPQDGIATFEDFTNDMDLYLPNFHFKPYGCITNKRTREEDVGDGEMGWWGILFGKDVKEFTEFKNNVAEVKDDHVLIYKEQFDSINDVYDLNSFIRLREYQNEEGETVVSFCVGNDGDNYEAEYDESFGSGYNTHDTQYAVYLYSSATDTVVEPIEPHEHVFGDWTSTKQNFNHKRVCTVEGCNKIEINVHSWSNEYTDNGDSETHSVTCDVCNYVEKVNHYPDRYWVAGDDGVYHYKYCQDCNGICAKEKHEFGDWTVGGDGLHYRSCEAYGCTETQRVNGCIPEETPIEIIKQPTCTEEGIAQYACITHSCLAIEKTIPALGHCWGEWEVVTPAGEGTMGLERRVCEHDENHIEERAIAAHEHTFGDWISADCNVHYKECTDENCQKIEEVKHNLVGTVVKMPTLTEEGQKEFACTECSYKEIRSMPRITPIEVIETADKEVKLEVTDETVAKIDEKTELKIEIADQGEKKEIESEAKENIQLVAGEKATVVNAYDISLVLDDVEVQPGGDVKVTLPAIDNSEDYVDVKVVHIADDGTVTECETIINEDGTISFITDHFSYYAVVATPLKTTEPGDVNSDGSIDTTDLANLKLYLAGVVDESEISADGADLDENGDIDTTDLATLKLKLAGIL
ncbi:MAG: dockerin type I repeat-containing protein [Clostridia bacterium]|nr:dockerin type I repeat-containing protein [Clostridia bacterium]